VSWQRIYNNLTVTTTHIKSSFRGLISLYSLALLQFPFFCFLNSLHSHSTTTSFGTRLIYIHFARAPRKAPSLNNSYACLPLRCLQSVSAGTCLPSCYLAVSPYVPIFYTDSPLIWNTQRRLYDIWSISIIRCKGRRILLSSSRYNNLVLMPDGFRNVVYVIYIYIYIYIRQWTVSIIMYVQWINYCHKYLENQ
jgi:hypothetical protein